MRPVQQNRRMRGRGNNNNRSKGPNPLSRNYESNGPDVKIRGNAQHIAEKYTTLARDAQSSGDRVIAENYLQHAEHYNRIILAAQAQAPVQYQRDDRDDGDEQDDDNGYDDNGGNDQQQDSPVQHQQINGSGPQPVIEGTPAEVAYGEQPVSQRQPHHQQRKQYDQVAINDQNTSNNDDDSESEDTAEAKPVRRAPRGRRPARPREPRAADEGNAPAPAAAVDTSNDLSPAGIVAEVKKRRAAVDSDV
ncbi:DUF4167 domain-containing protein [Phyllobacterium sp. 628]|uniref:DUF4167 domain-containing protein n=1 Tax=Phyllobacterium sp. 628 TaxID=2718938 RepID=UPI0016621DF1|nr:DUF4167 domain-containing protein [Phyllobacterium sp. 628]